MPTLKIHKLGKQPEHLFDWNWCNEFGYYYFTDAIIFSRRVVELLQKGAVMNRIFQPHEAHIPYILQVLCPEW